MPAPTTHEPSRPRWDSGRPRLALGFSAGLHSLALMGFLIYHAFPPKHASVVPVFEMVNLEPPKLRPLRPKTPTPPPPEKVETRAPEAPKLTSKPQKIVPVKPTPKVTRRDEDTTKPVKDTPEPTAELTTTIVANVPSDPRLSFWAARVKKIVENHWQPPVGIDVKGSAKTVIAFKVARGGTISEVSVTQGSGNSMLDDLAQRTILGLDQVPPIPENFPEDNLQVSYEFVYTGQ